ncbi:hypothetical protein U1Q18_025567 [Sarracenia purpurea var. burkii]
MAFLRNLFILFSLFFPSNSHLSPSTKPTFNLLRPSIAAIHDLLPQYGFPKGLIPNAVKSYSISPDGSFSVELDRPCYVQFDELVFYDKEIRGKLRYGSVSDVSGIQAKKLFLWLSVTGMTLDSDSGMIEFHVGALSQKLPAKQFEVIPNCKNKGCQDFRVYSRFGSM